MPEKELPNFALSITMEIDSVFPNRLSRYMNQRKSIPLVLLFREQLILSDPSGNYYSVLNTSILER